MKEREKELLELLVNACNRSAIYLKMKDGEYHPCVKLHSSSGKLSFVLRNRHLQYYTQMIIGWNRFSDMEIIENFKEYFWVCESDKIEDEYCYTLVLLKDIETY